jgi:hypothetical protein
MTIYPLVSSMICAPLHGDSSPGPPSFLGLLQTDPPAPPTNQLHPAASNPG